MYGWVLTRGRRSACSYFVDLRWPHVQTVGAAAAVPASVFVDHTLPPPPSSLPSLQMASRASRVSAAAAPPSVWGASRCSTRLQGPTLRICPSSSFLQGGWVDGPSNEAGVGGSPGHRLVCGVDGLNQAEGALWKTSPSVPLRSAHSCTCATARCTIACTTAASTHRA